MEGLTFTVAVIASVLVFFVRPVYGLIVYVAAFAYYPTYLSVPLGTIDFTVRRIIILAIFAKLFIRTNLPRRFKFIWLDKLVVIYFLCQILTGVIKGSPLFAFFENRAGAMFDMVLPYFAVRMIVKSRKEYIAFLKGILVLAVPLAIVGFYQCITGDNPVGFFRKYDAWKVSEGYRPISRFGFFRANLTFSHSIMYGLFFAMFGPVCVGLIRSIKNRHIILVGICIVSMGIGIFSSMSSGPILAGLSSILFIAVYCWRKYWKPIAIMIVIMCGSVEIVSNRHFYDVLGSFTLNPATAWYRSKLINVALFEGGMSGYWLTGFPYGVDPGWNRKIDGRDHTDIVNHYLAILYSFGLVGFLPFLVMIGAGVKQLTDAYKACLIESDTWLVWCMLGALFGILVAMNSVSLFGPPTSIFYIMLGFSGAMPQIVGKPNSGYSRKTRTIFNGDVQM